MVQILRHRVENDTDFFQSITRITANNGDTNRQQKKS